ncbi:hypothetical protein DAPPUDRAFT_233738 [Daphnia pulex]|uniref:Uncharacterized protein n=1 Tax=Daphnia pulex TaxID=6669 RepID=E9FVK7_DAPPU|nr:hypothetical protein DAPPUDRAFT_233738 [Daphnia pulex]|eukprot:EFX89090.1 hypothetical protein DAPPUDRAFT_233738 [Daphnia pulex]
MFKSFKVMETRSQQRPTTSIGGKRSGSVGRKRKKKNTRENMESEKLNQQALPGHLESVAVFYGLGQDICHNKHCERQTRLR